LDREVREALSEPKEARKNSHMASRVSCTGPAGSRTLPQGLCAAVLTALFLKGGGSSGYLNPGHSD